MKILQNQPTNYSQRWKKKTRKSPQTGRERERPEREGVAQLTWLWKRDFQVISDLPLRCNRCISSLCCQWFSLNQISHLCLDTLFWILIARWPVSSLLFQSIPYGFAYKQVTVVWMLWRESGELGRGVRTTA